MIRVFAKNYVIGPMLSKWSLRCCRFTLDSWPQTPARKKMRMMVMSPKVPAKMKICSCKSTPISIFSSSILFTFSPGFEIAWSPFDWLLTNWIRFIWYRAQETRTKRCVPNGIHGLFKSNHTAFRCCRRRCYLLQFNHSLNRLKTIHWNQCPKNNDRKLAIEH